MRQREGYARFVNNNNTIQINVETIWFDNEHANLQCFTRLMQMLF